MARELFRLSASEVRKLIDSGEVTVEDYAKVGLPCSHRSTPNIT